MSVLSKSDVDKIMEAASWAPTAHKMQNFEIVIIDDRNLIAKIALTEASLSPTFIRENFAQLSFSEKDLKKKRTGLLASAFPSSLINPEISDTDPKLKEHANLLRRQLNSSPVLGIVFYDTTKRAPASDGDFLGIISLGCVMENMWLMANFMGIAFHVVSTLSHPAYSVKIRKLLNVPGHLAMGYSFRLGYAVENIKYLWVRRRVQDFAYPNHMGKRPFGNL